MMKSILMATALSITASTASAGDSCPIAINIHDLGSPSWLDNTALISGLDSRLAWLGFRYFVTNDGIDVSMVAPDGPMAEAGITRDDTIISINANTIRSETEVSAVFAALEAGQTLTLEVSNGGATRHVTVTADAIDPVPLTIVQTLHAQECRTSTLWNLAEPIQDQIRAVMYDSNRRFRCDDAHIAIAQVHQPLDRNDVFILRGRRRIILAMPGWGTTCIDAASLDGTSLTQANALAVINDLIAAYVADRHANP